MKTGHTALPEKDLRGVKNGHGGFAPAETRGDQGGDGGPASRGKEANTEYNKGREFTKTQVMDPNGDATPACRDY